MAKPFDIFAHIYDLLQILILSIVEYGIVYDDPINGIISICSKDMIFKFFLVNLS